MKKVKLDYNKIYEAIADPVQTNMLGTGIWGQIFNLASRWEMIYHEATKRQYVNTNKGLKFNKWFAKVYKTLDFYNDFNVDHFYLKDGKKLKDWNKKYYTKKIKKLKLYVTESENGNVSILVK